MHWYKYFCLVLKLNSNKLFTHMFLHLNYVLFLILFAVVHIHVEIQANPPYFFSSGTTCCVQVCKKAGICTVHFMPNSP